MDGMDTLQVDPQIPFVERWYDADSPEVSIVVLNWNKAQLTIECVKSLVEHTQGVRYEIIVVDNGSRDEEFEKLSAFSSVHQILRLDVNRYFGEGNNLGAEVAKGKFVMFMNNDVTVTSNWLLPLVTVFRTHPDCGLAGPKFIYPHGPLQEAGALLDEDGDAVQIGKFQDPASPRFNRMRVVDYVSAACVIMRKEHFDQVLGFDLIYEPAYYEDADLCMKIGELGLKTFYVPEACIVHHENATTADPANGLSLRGLVQINRSKFARRWNTFLKTAQHEQPRFMRSEPVTHALDTSRRSAAVFTPHRIDLGETTRQVLSILRALDAIGYRVSLITPEKISRVRIEQIVRLTGDVVPAVSLETVKDRADRTPFDLFIAHGHSAGARVEPLGMPNYYWLSSYEALPGSSTAGQEAFFKGYRGLIFDSGDAGDERVGGLIPAQIAPGVRILTPGVNARRKLIVSEGHFIAGEGSNRQDMLIRAFRRMVEAGASAEMHLIGSLLPDAVHRQFFVSCEQLAEGLPVYFHIDAARDEIDSLNEEASVYWHAPTSDLVNAGGCPGLSALEAMSRGVIPLVASDSPTTFKPFDRLRFDSEDELVEMTQHLFAQSDEALQALRLDARTEAQRFDQEIFVAALRALLHDAI